MSIDGKIAKQNEQKNTAQADEADADDARGTDTVSAKARPLGRESHSHGGRPEDVGDGTCEECLESQHGRKGV